MRCWDYKSSEKNCALLRKLKFEETRYIKEGMIVGVYDFTVKTSQGKEKSLADYKGKVLVIVNTASSRNRIRKETQRLNSSAVSITG